MNTKNKVNPYLSLLPDYDQIPKAVFAAVAASFAMRLNGEYTQIIQQDIINEWECLYQNGLIPQKPIKNQS